MAEKKMFFDKLLETTATEESPVGSRPGKRFFVGQ